MAKITVQIEVDTEEKTMDVSINGEKVKNANYVSCYKYFNSYEQEDEVSVSVSASEKDDNAGVVKTTNYYSESSQKAKEIPSKDAVRTFAGFVGVKQVDATKAVAEFLLSKVR